MLKKLRIQLIAIIMVLVGTFLVTFTAVNVLNAQSSFTELVDRSLSQALEQKSDLSNNIHDKDSKSSPEAPATGSQEENGQLSSVGHLATVWADFSSEGVMLGSNQDMVSIDSNLLQTAISDALNSAETSGRIDASHLSWQKVDTSNGCRIAIADTTSIDQAILTQVLKAVSLCLAGLAILLILANILASMILEPIEKAWEQQHQFVADASHELKTPLAVILANIQILKQDSQLLPEDDRRWVESTSDEAQRMKTLVEELLELARTEESAGSSRRDETVDFSDIVEGETMQFDPVAFERGCEIETNVASNLKVKGDPDQLERLTKTLIDNACKYAATGTTVTVSLEKQGKDALLKVINKGTPIDPEDLPHLFDRFYRSDKARARDTGGFGLGLAIAKGIVESHKGKISCTSNESDGTCFTVELPLTQKS